MTARTPEMIVCCRVDDPDPACAFSSRDGAVIGTCITCASLVYLSPGSVEVIAEHGAQPWCIQCIAELPPGGVEIRRRFP